VSTEFSQACPLCGDNSVLYYHHDNHRQYLQCGQCDLVFVPRQYLLSKADEKAHYDTHENNPDDYRYRQFLNRLLLPLKEKLQPGARGLDFGCGPGPTLSVMLEELGFLMNVYDVFYANEPSVLRRKYDFITTTETVEHLHNPGQELRRLWSILKPGGHLGVMTQLIQDKAVFPGWRYIRDPTHVCFFSRTTFVWLARHWQATVEFTGNDVILLRKP
jgi:ribosomal protein S27AE